MDQSIFDGALWIAVFLFSTVCHEAAHAWSALKLGDSTAYRGGQVSFNPIPHIRREPIGLIVVPLLSWFLGGYIMGWASAPYDPDWARQYPKRLALMSLAGPGANLALAAIGLLILRLGLEWNLAHAPSQLMADHLVSTSPGTFFDFAGKALSIVVSLNLFLCAFNLLPLPPLDGSSLPLLFLPAQAGQRYLEFTSSPVLRMAAVFLLMRGFSLTFSPFYHLAAFVLYPSFNYT